MENETPQDVFVIEELDSVDPLTDIKHRT